jgi:hypothetical protein
LKGNQGNTFEAVKLLFSCEEKDGFKNMPHTVYESSLEADAEGIGKAIRAY